MAAKTLIFSEAKYETILKGSKVRTLFRQTPYIRSLWFYKEITIFRLLKQAKGFAVGLMTINRSVDLDLLNSQFDLGVFNGLRKPTNEDRRALDEGDEEFRQEIYIPDQIKPDLDMCVLFFSIQKYKVQFLIF